MAFLRTLFHREREPAPLCSAVIVAAGRASRMEGIDKILTPMGGQPLLLYTLAPFQACEQVGEIVIVTREDLMVPIGTLCSQHGLTKVRRVVKGGESRTESVLAGLQETDPQAALVAIHDGARPFLPEAVLEEAIQLLRPGGDGVGNGPGIAGAAADVHPLAALDQGGCLLLREGFLPELLF